ncbi:MAG: hypothetical protein EU536_02525 [Promethearchaeota archaeon]|nr:MAG: hypothetical protein EU536_02525 [Candidatus Lokiarchaeota archaeon]
MAKQKDVKTNKKEKKTHGSFLVAAIMIIIGGLLILGVLFSPTGIFGPDVTDYLVQDAVMNFTYGIIFIVCAWGIIQAEEWALGILSVTLFLIIVNRIVALVSGTESIPWYISIPIIIGAFFLILYLYKTRKIYD